jgi:hypothetical protein
MQVGELPKDNIFYVGQYGTSGYATAAKGYISKYILDGYNIEWHPLKFDDTTLDDSNSYNSLAKTVINKKHEHYDLFIYHSTPDLWKNFNRKFQQINKYKQVVGYTTWETDTLPVNWVMNINNEASEVWCPSTYNKDVFQNSGVIIPIKVVPHVFLKNQLPQKSEVNLSSFDGTSISNNFIGYTFYFIGELTPRKGIEDLISVYDKTFSDTDNVRLIIKTHYKNYNLKNRQYCIDSINRMMSHISSNKRIHFIIDNISDLDIYGLHSIGDCYVSLTKSEGFGLTVFDAFNYGKEIITTGYGGHMDFLGKDWNGLVDYKLDYVSGMDSFSKNYNSQSKWAYPNLNHASELMLKFYKYEQF